MSACAGASPPSCDAGREGREPMPAGALEKHTAEGRRVCLQPLALARRRPGRERFSAGCGRGGGPFRYFSSFFRAL